MAVTTSATVGGATYQTGSIREDLANWISNISRSETPFLSTIGDTKATSPRHDWQTDTLAIPAANAQGEGFSFDTANNEDITTNRIENYSQIFGKTVHTSGSLDESNLAGAAKWFTYAMKKRGIELRRDIEWQALRYDDASTTNAAGHVYKTSDTRNFAPVFAYTANWVRAAATTVEANNSAGTGTPITTVQGVGFNTTQTDGSKVVQYTAAPTNITLTINHVSSLMETMFNNGGRPSAVQIPSGMKAAVSKLLIDGNGGAAQRRASEMSKKVNLAVDNVMVEFGFSLDLVPNYIMDQGTANDDASTTVFFYDPAMIKKAVLKGMQVKKDGVARYAEAAIMFEECTLEVKNQNSLGAIIGVS